MEQSARKRTVIDQLNADFPAEEIAVDGSYLQIGGKFRAFLHADTRDLARTRAASTMGRNYLLFRASFIYSQFRLLPAKDSLSYALVAEIEANRLRSYQRRLERFGHGIGYIEYWDGTEWKVKAVPFNDPDFQIRLPLTVPEESTADSREEEPLEELPAVSEHLPEQEELPLLYPPGVDRG